MLEVMQTGFQPARTPEPFSVVRKLNDHEVTPSLELFAPF